MLFHGKKVRKWKSKHNHNTWDMMDLRRPTISGGALAFMGRLFSGMNCTVELRPCQAHCGAKGLRSKTRTCTSIFENRKRRETVDEMTTELCTMPCPTL